MEKLDSSFFHLCSEGTKSDVLFHDRDDFIEGMNIIAMSAAKLPVRILAFCIMDNHFHFILEAEPEVVSKFAFKISHLFNTKQYHRKNQIPLEPIKWQYFHIDSLKYLLNSIAYVLSNPERASYREWLIDYPWSTASLYYRDAMFIEDLQRNCRQIKDIPVIEMRKILHSKERIPEDWWLTKWGHIWPGSYLDWKYVEELFDNRKRFAFFLNSKQENEMTALSLVKHRIGLTDQEIRLKSKGVAKALYGDIEFKRLDRKQRIAIAEKVISISGCKKEQIFKILNLKLEG